MKQHLDIEGEDELATHYNGIEIDQRCKYIMMKVAIDIVKVCENHRWENKNFSKSKLTAPISVAMAKAIIESGKGPLLKSAEGLKLEEKKGFGYRILLGELMSHCIELEKKKVSCNEIKDPLFDLLQQNLKPIPITNAAAVYAKVLKHPD